MKVPERIEPFDPKTDEGVVLFAVEPSWRDQGYDSDVHAYVVVEIRPAGYAPYHEFWYLDENFEFIDDAYIPDLDEFRAKETREARLVWLEPGDEIPH